MMLVMALTACSVISAHAAGPEKAKLRIAVESQILNSMPLQFGVKLGTFRDQGLDVTIENFHAGGSKVLQALAGGSIDGTVGFQEYTIQMQAQGWRSENFWSSRPPTKFGPKPCYACLTCVGRK
ncbi:ABC-type nitrate/sulfonate/bicarbonate transport system substrate-binding protein [Bradyrhizobium sp. F1.13.1]